jgi:hypothetical protein
MASKKKPVRIQDHLPKWSRALAVESDLSKRDQRAEPFASVRDMQSHFKRLGAAERAKAAHRKALDDGDAKAAGIREAGPSDIRRLCNRMWDQPWCRALIAPWIDGERVLTHDDIVRMAESIAREFGEPQPLPEINTIRRQLARQFKKRVKSPTVDTLTG